MQCKSRNVLQTHKVRFRLCQMNDLRLIIECTDTVIYLKHFKFDNYIFNPNYLKNATYTLTMDLFQFLTNDPSVTCSNS